MLRFCYGQEHRETTTCELFRPDFDTYLLYRSFQILFRELQFFLKNRLRILKKRNRKINTDVFLFHVKLRNKTLTRVEVTVGIAYKEPSIQKINITQTDRSSKNEAPYFCHNSIQY